MNPTHDHHQRRRALRRPCGALRTYGGPQDYDRRRHQAPDASAADSVLVPAVVSTSVAARWLGVAESTIYRLAARWHPGHGTGNPIALSADDVLVCRALLAIGGPQAARLRQLAEAAIRARPARWLVLSIEAAATHTRIEQAARCIVDRRHPGTAHQVLDLWPPAWTGHRGPGVVAA